MRIGYSIFVLTLAAAIESGCSRNPNRTGPEEAPASSALPGGITAFAQLEHPLEDCVDPTSMEDSLVRVRIDESGHASQASYCPATKHDIKCIRRVVTGATYGKSLVGTHVFPIGRRTRQDGGPSTPGRVRVPRWSTEEFVVVTEPCDIQWGPNTE